MKALLVILLSLAASSLFADVVLPSLFQDHAVLQQGRPIPIWGTASPGESVTVALGEVTARVTADQKGHWRAELHEMNATAESQQLIVTGQNKLVIRDVVIGEVWLCSGQSNMEFTLSQAKNGQEEIASASSHLLWQFKVTPAVGDASTADVKGSWADADREHAGEFSAVAYFFAKALAARFPGVPIGLINSTWGATPVEAWAPPETIEKDPVFARVRERWQHVLEEYPAKEKAYQRQLAEWKQQPEHHREPAPPMSPGHRRQPGGLYAGMIAPLMPYAWRGVIWYQGEGNVTHANEYSAQFSTLITSWRARFGPSEVPFFWIQLPSFKNAIDPTGVNWAFLREQQTRTLALPHTGQVITLDLGESDNIHPVEKRPFGERLARLVLADVYHVGGKIIVPEIAQTHFEGASALVKIRAGSAPFTLGSRPVKAFAIAGADRIFHPADAIPVGSNELKVTASSVPQPIALRYAWTNCPLTELHDEAGNPLAPYRSDDW